MSSPMETVETQDWTNRELMLKTYALVLETNGTARLCKTEIYGQPELGIVGLKEQAAANTESRIRLLNQWRIIAFLGTAVAVIVFTMLGIMLAAVLGG